MCACAPTEPTKPQSAAVIGAHRADTSAQVSFPEIRLRRSQRRLGGTEPVNRQFPQVGTF